jgi:hypothetical protein
VRRSSGFLLIVVGACAGDAGDQTSVEVLRVAPAQMVGDSLEVTPALDTAQNTPEQGRVALSIEIQVRNAGGSTRHVPTIGFRAVPESGRDTSPQWRFDITRRTVDSLRAGERADFGLTTSPGSLATGNAADGVYRVEALLGDSATGRRTVPLGRIRLRAPADSV